MMLQALYRSDVTNATQRDLSLIMGRGGGGGVYKTVWGGGGGGQVKDWVMDDMLYCLCALDDIYKIRNICLLELFYQVI